MVNGRDGCAGLVRPNAIEALDRAYGIVASADVRLSQDRAVNVSSVCVAVPPRLADRWSVRDVLC
jgi:hypothetical protein